MAAKKTNSKKKSVKKLVNKEIIKEVAEKIIEREQELDEVVLEPAEEVAVSDVAEAIEEAAPIVEQDPPIEVMNGDPSVIVPINETFEIQEKAMENTFRSLKENKQSNRIIDRMFGYSWNGMEMDF